MLSDMIFCCLLIAFLIFFACFCLCMSFVALMAFVFGMMALGLVLCCSGAALLASPPAFLFYIVVAAALFIGFRGVGRSWDNGKRP
ncbi:MAG: hypothetical protein LBT63_03090 [Holosporaceae bacterium]|jgi:hypothetical protein|nr:hypothetical protein [Holosporaceae bacterium]